MMMMISIAWGKLELTCAVLALSVDRPMFLLLSDDFRCYSSFDQWHWSRSCVPFVGSHSGLLTSEGAYELFMSLRHNLVQVILWRKVLSLTCPRLLCGQHGIFRGDLLCQWWLVHEVTVRVKWKYSLEINTRNSETAIRRSNNCAIEELSSIYECLWM